MEHLIESVRKYPCLWNTTAIEYRDQELKDAAWAEVMKETDLSSVKEVKLKWKKLRDSYRDALKRQSELVARDGGGAGGKRPYPWKYMGHMAFLQPHMGARKRPEPEQPPAPPARPPPPPPPPQANGHHPHPAVSDSSSDSESARSEPLVKRRALLDIDRKLSYLCRREDPPLAAPAVDPLDIFFNSMCQATKRLGFGAQLKVKRALFEAVAAGEEALLAEQAELAALWARAPPSAPPTAPPAHTAPTGSESPSDSDTSKPNT